MPKQLTFLLIEDNDLDAEKIERAFQRLEIGHPIVRAKDGYEALEMLRCDGAKSRVRRPCLILLDLNMPRMSGIEFLGELRKEPKLSDIAVVVLTTSDRKQDVEAAYRHHVAGYIVKPVGRGEVLAAVGALDAYWNVCEHPEGA